MKTTRMTLTEIVNENKGVLDYLHNKSMPLEQLCKEANTTPEKVEKLKKAGLIEVTSISENHRLSPQGITLPVPRDPDKVEERQDGWWKVEQWNLPNGVVLERAAAMMGHQHNVNYSVRLEGKTRNFTIMPEVFWLFLRAEK